MKRSEMVNRLKEAFSEDSNYLLFPIAEVTERSETIAKIALNVVEESGMLPPRHPNPTFEQQLENRCLNFWEEEN